MFCHATREYSTIINLHGGRLFPSSLILLCWEASRAGSVQFAHLQEEQVFGFGLGVGGKTGLGVRVDVDADDKAIHHCMLSICHLSFEC
jgi:hypothetical protein